MNEREIIELIVKGDELGLKALQINYSPLIRYIISPILKDAREQEECLSEVIMKIWDKIRLYDPEKGSWNAWVTSIARNTALNRLRKVKTDMSLEDLPSDVPSSEPTPEEILIKREREQLLKHALGKLSQNDRAIFYRKYYYLQSTAQIAAELGTTERAVEGKLYRIKKKLRKLLGGDNYE
ncbi:MAG: sigma-70 family RNA polymerase sigma factor [Clostridia bacterium]|nr:sigma-70 family RNA polymerase sigma factor [Clostridia bacterium]MBO7319940.1 sigma-70 family RNA polymerase sigma factor [Clostridia bacterium]